MDRKYILLLSLIFLGSYFSFGQAPVGGPTCPPNIDFEFGDLSYWRFQNGSVASSPPYGYTLTPTAPVIGRETLTAGISTDAFGGFSIVDPGGGAYALKLGEDVNGFLTEQADYNVHVPVGVNNYSLIYRYAVVLQDPSHGASIQPRFLVNAFDSASGLATPCAQYSYVAGSGLPGFFKSPNTSAGTVWCKNWSTVSVNLSGLGGHTIDMRIIAQDCAAGGHWGYGYFDMTCGLFAIDSRICDDTLATLTGPSGFQSYTWLDSLTFTHIYGTTQVITMPIPHTATTFALIIQPYVGYGCPDTLYTRVMPSYLKMIPSNDTIVCISTPVSLYANATDSALDLPLQYYWGPATSLSCTNCSNPIATPAITTIYTVTVVDKAGCSKMDTVRITTDRITNTMTVVDDSCYGDRNGSATINITAGEPPYTYVWGTTPLQTGASAVSLVAGVYSVVVTDNKGCKDTTNAIITQPPPNNLRYTTNQGPTTCLGFDGFITLAGLRPSTGYTIDYDYNGLPATPQFVTTDGSGNGQLTGLRSGIYNNINVDVSKLPPPFCPYNPVGPLTLIDPPIPPAPAITSNSPVCIGDTLKLSVRDADAGVTFSWSGPSTFSWAYPDTIKSDTSLPNAVIGYAGTYSVTVTKNNCPNVASINVVIKPIPLPQATGDSVCSGSTLHLQGYSSNGATAYRWEGPDAWSSFVQNPIIPEAKAVATGTYTFTATLDGCIASTTTNAIVVQTPLAPIVSDTTYCQFDNPVAPLRAIGANMTWFDPNGNQMLSIPVPSTDLGGLTVWSVTQQTSDPNPRIPTCISGKAYDSVIVYKKYNPSLSISDSAICVGHEVTFTVNNTGDDHEGIRWALAANDSIRDVNPLKHAFDAIGTYTISVTPLHQYCPNPTLTQLVNVFPYPVIDLGPDTTICLGSQSITLMDNINAGNKAARWLWNTNETNASIVITKPGEYYSRVVINGCPAADTVIVLNDCYLNIPNIFTPNGDGVNDYFFPRQLLTKGLISFKMDIYNRWGQLIFTTNSLDGMGWDGKFNNAPQPEGVYVYIIEASFKDGQMEHHNGNITLLR